MMAEFWQSYGSWILYGLFFALMLRLHGGAHGEHGGHCAHRDGAKTAGKDPAAGQSHEEAGKSAHSHRRGCC